MALGLSSARSIRTAVRLRASTNLLSRWSDVQLILCTRGHHSDSSSDKVPLSIASFQLWGANTDVGKTLVSAGLLRHAIKDGKVLFLKPVQTGFPTDSDARLLGAVTGCQPSLGRHAAELFDRSSPVGPAYDESVVHTEFAWQQPVSPHLAVHNEGRAVEDADVQACVTHHLNAFARCQNKVHAPSLALAVVETAGGPASPGPSGRLQCDIYRPLRLPAVLVGDGKLGGISTTLAAHEMLCHRGYDVAAVALLESAGAPNADALRAHLGDGLGRDTPIFSLPTCECSAQGVPESGKVDSQLAAWLEASSPVLQDLLEYLREYHRERVAKLSVLAKDTLEHVWYPFTQHSGLEARDITVIDARSGDNLLVFKGSDQAPDTGRMESHFDACASWWTQGVNEQLHSRLVSETMKGVARYGHVMHPNAAIEPTLLLAKMLLESVGRGWASRVFYSDDGSTAVEVALKMAFRKYWKDHPDVELRAADVRLACELKVLGIDGGYHGDTLGAMDAVAPSPYNGPAQFPWYQGRGLFLKAPYVGFTKGRWRLKDAVEGNTESWTSLDDLLSSNRHHSAAAQIYQNEIISAIDRFEAKQSDSGAQQRLAACIVEPLLQGAGGMLMMDPLFQRCLVDVCRKRKIPVIFDEVFTGLWRLGRSSAAELLGLQPDIACYAKLLTGGLLPLSTTLASSAVFESFGGESKLEALLHGHSYSGHAAGASAGVAALQIFSQPGLNPALESDGKQLRQLWPADLVERLSYLPGVVSLVAIGTVLAAELATKDGGGYASSASATVVQRLRARGVFARPLGNVVYLMVTPTTHPAKAAALLSVLIDILVENADQGVVAVQGTS